jgi:hypothetical protein
VDAVVNYIDIGSLSNSEFISLSFAICDFQYQPDFSLYSLVKSLNFEQKFYSGRFAKLFGNLPYSYSNTKHSATKFSENLFVTDMFNYVTEKFPTFELNSCLINYYPDRKSYMPDHSDDELHIDPDSFIVTLSLGSERTLYFKHKRSKTVIASVNLSEGMTMIFSKNSQDIYTHGIPPNYNTHVINDYMPRISATFRKLRII